VQFEVTYFVGQRKTLSIGVMQRINDDRHAAVVEDHSRQVTIQWHVAQGYAPALRNTLNVDWATCEAEFG